MRFLFLFSLLLALAFPAQSAKYIMRVDGGDASQCTGLVDAKYPGTGTGLACAWGGLMVALPPTGDARLKSGDSLEIRAGSYMVGYGAVGAVGCSAAFPYSCTPVAVPPAVKITGDCKKRPELWGTQRAYFLLDLSGSDNSEVSCLEFTDHAQCAVAHSGSMACERNKFPYGEYADRGIKMIGAAGVKLSKLNIHGFAVNGMWVGRVRDLTVEDVRIAGNGWSGWEGDTNADGTNKGSSNEGFISIRRILVEANGCIERYPASAYTANTPAVAGCWGQSAGGYGDGLGTGQTNGDWTIDDSVFRNNVSDGLDLLYHRAGNITVTRSRFRNNAGNQVKLSGNALFANNVVQGVCGFFDKKPFTYNVDNCRALGDAAVFSAVTANDTINVLNNTVQSEGNITVFASGAGATVRLRNNILIGLPFFLDPGTTQAPYYSAAPYVEGPKLDDVYSLYQTTRNVDCKKIGAICGSAGLVAATRDTLNVKLQPTSAARNSGTAEPLTPQPDFLGNPRIIGTIDRGATEAQ